MVDNEQEAADFLDRLDIDVNDLENKTKFELKLFDIFARGGKALPTDNQVETLFEVAETQFLDFPSVGIKRIEFLLFDKPQTRFVIPNFRGLFGFTKALEFLKEFR